MKNPVTVLSLLVSSAVSSIAAECDPNAPYFVQPYDGETTKDPAMTKQLIEYWSENTCYKKSDDSEPSMTKQCKDVCFPGAEDDRGAVLSSSTCNFGSSPWSDARTGNPLLCGADKNFAGVMIKTGYCTCNSPIIEILGDFFVEGILEAGKILEKVICPALHALDVVMAIGMAAIPPPGKAITGGMIAAAKSAKTYKYAYEAQDAAQEWADFFLGGLNLADKAGCGPLIKIPSKDDLIKRAFEPLSNAPDEVVPGGMNYESLPCPKKGCRGCKGPKCKKDDSDDNKGSSTTGSQPTPMSVHSQPEQSQETPKTTAPPTESSADATSSTSFATPIATLGCKGLAARYTYEENSEIERRIRSYPIDVQSNRLKKRKPKKAKACDFDLTSFDYYSSGLLKAKNPRIYGFNDKHSCDNYDWGTPDATAKYESEHVLEWQVVGGFFNKMGEDIKDDFDDPDPRKTGKIKFCEYWLQSWRFRNKQLIDDPLLATPATSASSSVIPSSGLSNSPLQTPIVGLLPSNGSKFTSGSSSVVVQPPQVSLVGGGPLQRTRFHWLASQYPSKKMWVEEMPLLEKALNGENKEKLFIQKKRIDGKYYDIREEEMMKSLAKGQYTNPSTKLKDSPTDQARQVIKYIREMTGTFIYMQDKHVATIFANEKNRMGAIIGAIDKHLHKTPRQEEENTKIINFTPWKEQGLGDKWNQYMDDVFERAKQRGIDYVNLHLGNLDKEWNSQKKKDEFKIDAKDDAKRKDDKRILETRQKEIVDLIAKTRKEWEKVKNWEKPKNW